MSDYPIRLRATVDERGALIKALLQHPMENGFNKSVRGDIVPAHFITDITLHINGELVASVLTGSGVAADPLFGWRITGVKRGDQVSIAWRDNLGNRQSKDVIAQ